MQNPKEHTMIDTRLKVSLDELTLKSELSYLFYIEKLGLLGFSIGLLEFPAGILVQQSSEMAGMLRTNHDASSTRDTFLFIGLVRLIHVDGICRAHLCASMTGCTLQQSYGVFLYLPHPVSLLLLLEIWNAGLWRRQQKPP